MMEKNVNRFEIVGKIAAVRKNEHGNTYIDLTVTQGDVVLKPTVFVPKDVPITLSLVDRVYVSGYVLGIDTFNEKTQHSLHEQTYHAQKMHIAGPTRNKRMPEEFFNVYVTGELIRILDSGNGWKKVVLQTIVKEGEKDVVSNVSIGYLASDRKLIKPSDLETGKSYEILIKPVTPERTRKDNGRKVVYQNLVAEYSRMIA